MATKKIIHRPKASSTTRATDLHTGYPVGRKGRLEKKPPVTTGSNPLLTALTDLFMGGQDEMWTKASKTNKVKGDRAQASNVAKLRRKK